MKLNYVLVLIVGGGLFGLVFVLFFVKYNIEYLFIERYLFIVIYLKVGGFILCIMELF